MTRRKWLPAAIALIAIGAPASLLYPPPAHAVHFPKGKRFAFSIVDDTDSATVDRVKPIYDLLYRSGLHTTKTVWVFGSRDLSNPANYGESLSDAGYRDFILDLQKKGFEIALHGVRGGSSTREETLSGLEEFKRILGRYPTMHINHSANEENLYWGRHVYVFGPYRWTIGLATSRRFSGHEPDSPYFWGDAARKHIKYVARFTFSDPNLLAINPAFPYHLQQTPYVNYWFPTANGARAKDFNSLLRKENLDRLEQEGGVCLVYTHLGGGSFNANGVINREFEARIKDLASRQGWFAPASEILDYLAQQPTWTGTLGYREHVRLETQFVSTRVLFGLTR